MKSIYLSAGHGGANPYDPGAIGNGFKEAEEALKIRDAVATELRLRDGFGFQDKFLIATDGAVGQNVSLKESLKLAQGKDIKVEFHFNASDNKTATGVEALAKSNLRLLSQKLCLAIVRATGLSSRGGDSGYKDPSSGQHHRLAFCEAGGVILEVCFISNPNDMKKYKDNFNFLVNELANALEKEANKVVLADIPKVEVKTPKV